MSKASSSAYSAVSIDGSIHQFLKDLPTPPASMRYALITCLDSSINIPSLLSTSSALDTLATDAKVVGQGILVSTKRLLAAEQANRIFFGFDEVWFFPSGDVSAKPSDVFVAGPTHLAAKLPPNLVRWLERNKCTLGLGDGTGLNMIARLQGVAKLIVNQFAAVTPQDLIPS